MNNPVVRSAAAVFGGLLVAVLTVAVVEMAGHMMFPPPPGLDASDPVEQARLIESIPKAALAFVVGAWFLGSLAGTCVAILIGGRILPAWTVALTIAALGLWTTQMFPHPPGMVAAALVLPLIAVLVAKHLMAARLPQREP